MVAERRIAVSAEDIERDEAFRYFVEKHDISESTRRGYITAYQRYVEFTGLTLTQLIEEAEAEEAKSIPVEKRKIGQRIRSYRKHLKSEGLAASTIRGNVAAIKSLYENGYSLRVPSLGKDRDLANNVKTENKGLPASEEIRKALNIADTREKAVILGITSSGLSITDFLDLTVKDFKEGYDEETGITILDMRRKKTSQDFVTFFSTEATQAIEDYLAWRNRPKPKTRHPDILKGWENHRIFSDNDYLIIKKFVPHEFSETHEERLRREDEKGLQTVFRHLANRAGIARDKGMYNMFRGHKLRAWFYSTLINSGCPQDYAEVFMGHTSRLGSSNGAYYSAIIPKLKGTYLEYMPHLSLLAPVEVKVVETEGYKELIMALEGRDSRIKDLEAKIATLKTDKEEELATLKQQFEKQAKEIELLKAQEKERAPLDDKMTELMERLLSNPEMEKLIKKEIEAINEEDD